MGIGLIILASIFLVFQTDINQYQRQMEFVHDVAEEAAATAALEIVLGDDGASNVTQTFANGFIKFKSPEAANAGMTIVKKNLKLDSAFVSADPYFSEAFHIVMYSFNQDGSYSKFIDGVKITDAGTFAFGDNFSDYCDSPYKERVELLTGSEEIIINYPSTVCIIDAGKPRFRDSFGLKSLAKNIVEIGVYEYKHY